MPTTNRFSPFRRVKKNLPQQFGKAAANHGRLHQRRRKARGVGSGEQHQEPAKHRRLTEHGHRMARRLDFDLQARPRRVDVTQQLVGKGEVAFQDLFKVADVGISLHYMHQLQNLQRLRTEHSAKPKPRSRNEAAKAGPSASSKSSCLRINTAPWVERLASSLANRATGLVFRKTRPDLVSPVRPASSDSKLTRGRFIGDVAVGPVLLQRQRVAKDALLGVKQRGPA